MPTEKKTAGRGVWGALLSLRASYRFVICSERKCLCPSNAVFIAGRRSYRQFFILVMSRMNNTRVFSLHRMSTIHPAHCASSGVNKTSCYCCCGCGILMLLCYEYFANNAHVLILLLLPVTHNRQLNLIPVVWRTSGSDAHTQLPQNKML